MAVSIDTVYQRVLSVANKEQRGYVTPQEFNLFANQAQMDIFEQYFYDLNQFSRLKGNNLEYADMVTILEEKIAIFKKRNQAIEIINQYGDGILPSDLYRLGTVLRFGLSNVPGSPAAEMEEVSEQDYMYYSSSPLASPSKYRPIYIRSSATTIKIYPYSTTINTGLDKSAALYFQQTGKARHNGQDNQFAAVGFSVTLSVTQASPDANVYMPAVSGSPSAPISQIKVGQVVTDQDGKIATSPATTVKSFTAGATTDLGTGGITNTSNQFTVVAPTSGNGAIAIGQYIGSAGFPNGATVIGVQGNLVRASVNAEADVSAGTVVNFLSHLTLSQPPTSALTTANSLLFNEVDALSYVETGQTITGSGVQSNTTVAAINGDIITLSNDFTSGGGKTLTFASDDVKCNYVRKPLSVSWNYTEINGVAMYNSSNSTGFELHESEETELVFKILQLAGIAMESMDLYQVAAQEEIRNIQQEKQ